MKGRKYLRRLTIVILFGILVPALTAFVLFRKSALESNEQSNERAYDRAFTTYTSLLDRKIQDLESYAARISAESRDYRSLLQNGFGTMEPYRIYQLTQELRERYLRNDVTDWGIYSYDNQRVITSRYSCQLSDFLFKYTGARDDASPLAGFFSEEEYQPLDTIFGVTGGGDPAEARLMIGVCTRIGATNDRAMVFYVLSPTDVEESMAMVGGEGISYYLLDQERNVLLSWGDLPEENAGDVLQQSEWRRSMGVNQKVRYTIKSRYPALSVMAYIWESPLQNAIIELLNSIWIVLIGILALVLLVGGMAIYVSYKPVQELTEKFDYTGGNEFELVLNKMNSNVSKIDEQQTLITDLLMNHLLFGVPIATEQIQQLGVVENSQYYCVFLMDGYSFVNSEMAKKLTAELEQSCKAHVFVTDWYEGSCNVVICFMEQQDTAALEEKLKEWLQKNCSTTGTLYTGPAYNKLKDIQQSFRSCVEQRKKRQQKLNSAEDTVSAKKTKQKEILRQILAYLEDDFRNAGISQVQVADKFQISNYTLSRIFKSETGVGFAEYLSSKRLEYAKELLRTTNYSIRDIALMSGFTNENYFSRTFKLYTGTVPSAFRKQEAF